MPDDGGRDGFSEFPGSPTIVVQVTMVTFFAFAQLFVLLPNSAFNVVSVREPFQKGASLREVFK